MEFSDLSGVLAGLDPGKVYLLALDRTNVSGHEVGRLSMWLDIQGLLKGCCTLLCCENPEEAPRLVEEGAGLERLAGSAKSYVLYVLREDYG